MVILQFNKLIRNKWVWGVFAIVVSAAFCLDDFFRPSNSESPSDEPLKNLKVSYDAALEAECRDALRVQGGDVDRSDRQEQLYAFYAAASSLDEAGIIISDAELGKFISEAYLARFENDQAQYKQWVQDQYKMDVGRFERAVRRFLQVQRGAELTQAVATWVSPMELDQLRHDASDQFSVRAVSFDKDEMLKKEGEIVPDVGAWYSNNLARVTLPTTYTFSYVEIPAEKMGLEPTDEEITARYDADKEKLYTETNGTETVVKKLEDVRSSVVETIKSAKFDAFVKGLKNECDDQNDAFADDKAKDKRTKPSWLATLAESKGVEVKSADNVAVDQPRDLVPGFVTPTAEVFGPFTDCRSLKEAGPADQEMRYAMVKDVYTRRVWIVEATAEKAGRRVELDEACKQLIHSSALADERQKRFEAAVKAVVAQGKDEVLKVGKAEAAQTYTMATCPQQLFGTICQLNEGDISDLIGNEVFVCESRTAGDYDALATADRMAFQMVGQMRPLGSPAKWMSYNLKQLGYEGKAKTEN